VPEARTGPAPADRRAAEQRSPLRGTLWLAFVVQLAAISLATLLSVFGAWIVLRDVLIQRALMDEATHYWQRYEREPGAALPDTFNLRAYLRVGDDDSGVPEKLRALPPGYHIVPDEDSDDLVYVEDGPRWPLRLYLVFKQEQVDALALWFGFVPLALVLMVIYLMAFLFYRASRRAVSPVIWLAGLVRGWDPKHPDTSALEPEAIPADAGEDVRVLAGALRGFARRLDDFVERERNFTRDASHELRTPITVIKVAADVLETEEELSPFAQRSVGRIQRSIRDMEALIESFLILAREGDVGLPEEDFVVNEIVGDEAEKAESLVVGRPVVVRVVHEAQFALHAPSRVLAVMLSNLLRNACAYTEQGEVTVTVGEGYIRVADTGLGMSPEELKRVFEPFYRAKSGEGKRGSGVGLTIVRRLSDRFGWPVEIESERGVGTRVTIRFPNAAPA
jgi:signal transduction histidine kinase